MTEQRQSHRQANLPRIPKSNREAVSAPNLGPALAQSQEIQGLLNGSDPGTLQAKGSMRSSAADPRRAAADGLRGAGQTLPHMARIQQAFGPTHDLSTVQAQVGGSASEACSSMGATAYAQGERVGFRETPDLRLAAHEAAHVVQQRAGVSLSGGVGKTGDRYEQQADQVADRVASGKSAADLLPETSSAGTGAPAVQCYKDRIDDQGDPIRLSDDGKMAVFQASVAGSNWACGDPGLIKSASSQLEAAKSVIRLEGEGAAIRYEHEWWLCSQNSEGETVHQPVFNDESVLVKYVMANPDLQHYVAASFDADWEKVEASAKFGKMIPDGVVQPIKAKNLKSQISKPEDGDQPSNYTEKETSGDDMKLWPDCGRAGRTVSGADKGTGSGRGGMKAGYDDAAAEKTFAEHYDPAIQKSEILIAHYGADLKKLGLMSKIESEKALYKSKRTAWSNHPGGPKGSAGAKAKKKLYRESVWAAKRLHDYARTVYDSLTAEQQDALDKKAGINKYADPEIGEAFHISTHGSEHPELNPVGTAPEDRKGTWNFHWAGVIMKSGADTMTLEGYADGTSVQNSDWVFQLYGVGSPEKGKSFHEQHRDVHKQHGTKPTSMAMRPSYKIKPKKP